MVQSPGSPSERLIGRYALYSEIASGGMATVHFGRLLGPVGFSRTVAIKRLHAQFAKDPEFVAMFLDEARLAGRIQHPNVVSTLDVVALEGELFLVMEYVQGESLAKLLGLLHRSRSRIPPKVVTAIVSGVLYGLHAAHEATDERGQPLSIIHRDVSPQNVLVGVDGVARVLDFGVAKAENRVQATREGEIKGKLAYMAPEQMKGAPMDRRADIYGAAVVLWEALVARRLFDGEHPGVIFSKVMSGEIEPPSRLVEGVPPALDEIVLSGLSRDLPKRYETARAMAMDLEDRVGVASPRQVSEWLSQVAGEVLWKRAARVKEIESISTPPPMTLESLAPPALVAPSTPPSPRSLSQPVAPQPVSSQPGLQEDERPTEPALQGPLGGDASMRAMTPGSSSHAPQGSQVSGIAVTSPSALTPSPSRARWLLVGGAALAVVALLLVVLLRREPPALAESSASASPSAAPDPRGASSVEPSMALLGSPPVDPALPASGAPLASAAPGAPTTSPVASSPQPRAGQAGGRATSAPGKVGECAIPFTIDANGIKRIKPQCL